MSSAYRSIFLNLIGYKYIRTILESILLIWILINSYQELREMIFWMRQLKYSKVYQNRSWDGDMLGFTASWALVGLSSGRKKCILISLSVSIKDYDKNTSTTHFCYCCQRSSKSCSVILLEVPSPSFPNLITSKISLDDSGNLFLRTSYHCESTCLGARNGGGRFVFLKYHQVMLICRISEPLLHVKCKTSLSKSDNREKDLSSLN